MKIATKKYGKAAAVLATALAASGASALPVALDQLYFTQFAGWDSSVGGSTFTPGTTGLTGLDFDKGVAVVGAPAGAVSIMDWNSAVGPNESSIEIISYNDSTTPLRFNSSLTAADATPGEWNEGDWWVIDTLLQTNEVLTAGPDFNGIAPNPLWVADTLANLSLFTDVGRTDLLGADLNSVVGISFFESRNNVGCGSQNPLGTSCDDVFTVAAVDFAPIQFVRDGFFYDISFTLIPGPSTNQGVDQGTTLVCPSADPRCVGVTVPAGEIRVFTPEFNPGTSSINVAMRFDTRPVPAPGVLGLVGAGAFAVSFLARRRRKNKA